MISIEQVNFSYSKQNSLFSGLDLKIERNKIYGLLGRNGMGKSTLLKLMAGFLRPESGTLVAGEHTPSQRNVAFMQRTFFLNEHFSLPPIPIDNYLRAYSGFYPNFSTDTFYSILKEFEVDKNKNISTLSFGQKKKLLIAFSLSTNVDYVFLDEPTNGLDIPSKSQFRKLMARNFAENQSIIISTHQIRDLSNLLDAVIIIDKGEIILSKEISEIEKSILFSNAKIRSEAPLFSEMSAGGTIYLYPNTESLDSKIEIETFFNAIVQDRDSLLQLLK